MDEQKLTEQAGQIERLLEKIESLPDPALREKAVEILQSLLSLYGAGLARIFDILHEHVPADEGAQLMAAFAQDNLISHLLLLHDLHPVDVETRVAQAIDDVRPFLQAHGGDVELIAVEDGTARVRLHGSCNGCPSSTATLKAAIEDAIYKAAPDLDGIAAVNGPNAAFVPLSALIG